MRDFFPNRALKGFERKCTSQVSRKTYDDDARSDRCKGTLLNAAYQSDVCHDVANKDADVPSQIVPVYFKRCQVLVSVGILAVSAVSRGVLRNGLQVSRIS